MAPRWTDPSGRVRNRRFDLDAIGDTPTPAVQAALASIFLRSERKKDDLGVKVGALTFQEIWEVFAEVFNERMTEDQARRMLLRWRGEDPRKRGRLFRRFVRTSPDDLPVKVHGHPKAWLESVPENQKLYRVTDHALRAIGMGQEAGKRQQEFDHMQRRMRAHRKVVEARSERQIDRKAMRALHKRCPDGGDLDDIHAALARAGSTVSRRNVRVYVQGLVKRGWLIKLARGRYRVNTERYGFEKPKPAEGPRAAYRRRKAADDRLDAKIKQEQAERVAELERLGPALLGDQWETMK